MRTRCFTPGAVALAILSFVWLSVQLQGQPSPANAPVHMVVTVEAHHGTDVPLIHREDVMVHQGHDRDQVTDWVPLQGDHGALQFFVLLDDGSEATLGLQFNDLRQFINSQPPNAAVAVGYMRNGTVEIAQDLTTDHTRAANALRLPLGSLGATVSPYLSIEDLIKRWPEGAARREMLVISDGIDRLGGIGLSNPYVDSAIAAAQRAGIIIYTIYATGVGHFGHSFWRINWGQNYLAKVTDETGGESYFLGLQTPVSFAPYLEDLQRRLTHQFLLGFIPKPEKKAGLQPVKVKTEVPNAEIVAADRVYVPAGEQ